MGRVARGGTWFRKVSKNLSRSAIKIGLLERLAEVTVCRNRHCHFTVLKKSFRPPCIKHHHATRSKGQRTCKSVRTWRWKNCITSTFGFVSITPPLCHMPKMSDKRGPKNLASQKVVHRYLGLCFDCKRDEEVYGLVLRLPSHDRFTFSEDALPMKLIYR
jgi:hypothetical protein